MLCYYHGRLGKVFSWLIWLFVSAFWGQEEPTALAFLNGLKCRECGREYPADPLNVCDFCFGPLEVVYDYATISEVVSQDSIAKGPLSIWRYKDLLPAEADDPVDIMAGYTPLIKARGLGKSLGLNNLYIKNDSVNPSFSFKDRVVSVAATKAIEFGYQTIALSLIHI